MGKIRINMITIIINKNKYISYMHLKTLLESWKNQFFNHSKQRKIALFWNKKSSELLRGIKSKHIVFFMVWIVFIRFKQKKTKQKKK